MALGPDKQIYSFAIDRDLLEAAEAVKARDGIPVAEQIRRALREWLAKVQPPAGKAKRRVSTRTK